MELYPLPACVKFCSLLVHWTNLTITPPQLLQKALFMVPASVSSSFQISENQPVETRPPVTILPVAPRKHILPEAYTTVPAVALTNSTIFVPKCDIKPAKKCLDQAKEEEIKWVENSSQLLKKADLNKGDTIAWAAYHASQELPYHAYGALRLQSGQLVLMLSRTSPHQRNLLGPKLEVRGYRFG